MLFRSCFLNLCRTKRAVHIFKSLAVVCVCVRACVCVHVRVCVCVCVRARVCVEGGGEGKLPIKHHNSCCTSFCGTWSAMTHNMRQCVQNWKEKDGDLTFLNETQETTTATTPKCWDYCTCSGSCRGVELKGVLFSTLPRIYKHNTISPQRVSLRLLHLCYSVISNLCTYYQMKWLATCWVLYFPKCPVLLNKPCTRFLKKE